MNVRSCWTRRESSPARLSLDNSGVTRALSELAGAADAAMVAAEAASTDPEAQHLRAFATELLYVLYHQGAVAASPYRLSHDSALAVRQHQHQVLAKALWGAAEGRVVEVVASLELIYQDRLDPDWDFRRLAPWLSLLAELGRFGNHDLYQPLWVVPRLAACHPLDWWADPTTLDEEAYSALWELLTEHPYGVVRTIGSKRDAVLRRLRRHADALATDPLSISVCGKRVVMLLALLYFLLAAAHAATHKTRRINGDAYGLLHTRLSAVLVAFAERRRQWQNALSAMNAPSSSPARR